MRSTAAAVLVFMCMFAREAVCAHRIEYVLPGAREVFIVYGINGWRLPDSLAAEGWIKDKLAWAPMKHDGDGLFSVSVPVHSQETIDFVFWITKGPGGKGVDIWDSNRRPIKDFHAIAVENTVTRVESTVNPSLNEQPSLTDFAWPFATLALCIAVAGWLAVRRRSTAGASVISLFVIAIVFIIGLILGRIPVAGLGWQVWDRPLTSLPEVMWTSRYDLLYALIVSVIFISAALLIRGRSRAAFAGVIGVFIFVCLVSVVFSIVNVRIVAALGRPLNYQWIYYSGFLRSADAKSAIASQAGGGYAASIAVVVAGLSFAGIALYALAVRLLAFKNRMYVATGATSSAVLVALVFSPAAHTDPGREQTVNPVVELISSCTPFSGQPALYTMHVPDSLLTETAAAPIAGVARDASHVRNVLVVVLESTSLLYTDVGETRYGVTPYLKQMTSHAHMFTHVYAHAPATNFSMFSMLAGIYPPVSYLSVTEETPSIELPTLSSLLAERGYRTAFFNSADNRYQKAGEFLSHHGFSVITDASTPCSPSDAVVADRSGWQYMDGKNDACTAGQMMSWVTNGDRRPFFAMLWTYQTHYPYFFSGQQRAFARDSTLNRYLNALHHADSILGDIVLRLDKAGALDSTLVVVIGDHGEAFGQHGQISHASRIYEENLLVPCLYFNPRFAPLSRTEVCGMVDLAPTILNYLGAAAPPGWSGESMHAKTAESEVYFFSPWSDELFGYRRGDTKVIYNASKGNIGYYDLSRDPGERTPLQCGSYATDYHYAKIAAWVQRTQRRFGMSSE